MNLSISLPWVVKRSRTTCSYITKLGHSTALLGLDPSNSKCDEKRRA
jgi:hypothetical protein